MKSARNKHPIVAPDSWEAIAHGEWLQQELNILLEPLWGRMFGYSMLKLGGLANGLDSSHSTIRNQFSLSLADDADIRADLTSLPIASSSIDAVVAPFCLEFNQDPHQVIREAVRVLIPYGYLMVIGFNPYGMVSLGKLGRKNRKNCPWNGRFFSQYRIRDWLQLLGNEVVEERKGVYASLRGRQAPSPLQQLLVSHYMPGVGSVYIMMARKREIPLNLIKAKWRKRTPVKPIGILSGANYQLTDQSRERCD